VISRDCANHGAVYYAFVVNGRSQAGRAPWGSVNCISASVGDPVTVYYDPANPTVHTLKEPRLVYEEKRGFYVPVWFAVPLLFVLMVAAMIFNAKFSQVRPAGKQPLDEGDGARPVRKQDECQRFARAQFDRWLQSPAAAQLSLGPGQCEIVLESETAGHHNEGIEGYTLTRFLRNAEGRYVLFKSTPTGPYVKLIADNVAKAALKSLWVAPTPHQG
jgi:hypothetical protein